MNSADAKQHMTDMQNQISFELFHKESLTREIEILRPRIESKIVTAKRTTDIRNLTVNDLNIDLVPASLADMETIQARKAFYYANKELAQVVAAIDALTNMYNSYKGHMKQEFDRQAKPLSDNMIYDAYKKVQEIKNLTKEEKTALKNIGDSLMTTIHSGSEMRLQTYETLQNIISQHILE